MFDPAEFADAKIAEMKETIGDAKAIIACSGGVDSMVSAAIASRAIGERLLAVYVDTGLMRKGETEEVRGMMGDAGLNYKVVDASEEFFGALSGVEDPEAKRKIIGELFIRAFEREAKGFGAEFLVQGTIAPDVIESGSVKSHHNVGGLPEKMGLGLCEPLIDLFKEEVRAVGRHLGVESSGRQPFPGPALAVRCLGEVTPGKIAMVREACHIVEEEITKAADEGKMALPWQYFAVLLPTRSVGMVGKSRAYGMTVVVRAVESTDAMTARHSRIPSDVLDAISRRITSNVPDVSRVVYDITDKPPGTIEWE